MVGRQKIEVDVEVEEAWFPTERKKADGGQREKYPRCPPCLLPELQSTVVCKNRFGTYQSSR